MLTRISEVFQTALHFDVLTLPPDPHPDLAQPERKATENPDFRTPQEKFPWAFECPWKFKNWYGNGLAKEQREATEGEVREHLERRNARRPV